MLKKSFIIVIFLCAFGSLGGVFLAGLNMYTRSTTPQEEAPASSEATATTTTENIQAK
ncbi:hypothetical protein [Serratia sp. NPDC087055]|uniref:hypothetical protein n=1 Tax=Serratia sp. NPDC087055 TaxID=3364516 RepID=UPI00384E8533